jgi:hypothetical protein
VAPAAVASLWQLLLAPLSDAELEQEISRQRLCAGAGGTPTLGADGGTITGADTAVTAGASGENNLPHKPPLFVYEYAAAVRASAAATTVAVQAVAQAKRKPFRPFHGSSALSMAPPLSAEAAAGAYEDGTKLAATDTAMELS